MKSVTVIAATRQPNEDSFDRLTLLGISLRCMPPSLRPAKKLTFNNSGPGGKGLPEVYNEALDDEALETDGLAFVHDDVYIHDWFVGARLTNALREFDLVGVAGSVNPQLKYPSWGLSFDEGLNPTGWQNGLVSSGAVNHFDYACPSFVAFGDTPARCKLLDGLFLAVSVKKARQFGLRFDSQFSFHCYDLDFCRSAEGKDLKIGTWPIAVTHGSAGDFTSESFKKAARKYIKKWSGSAQ
jgi:hypothetical protein